MDDGGTRIERVRADRRERLEALVRGAGAHLEPLLDVGSAPNGDLLLVLPAPAARAVDLLGVPGWPTRAEAVTLLAPLAEALDRMHAAGAAHGGVGPAAVVLDAAGTPMLTAPHDPVLAAAAGERAFSAAVEDDRQRYRSMVRGVLAGAGVRIEIPPGEDCAAVADAVFRVADPAPLRLAPVPPRPSDPVPSRLLPAPSAPGPTEARPHPLAALRAVRPRVWATAGAALAMLATAVIVLPGGGADATPPASSSAPLRSASSSSAAPTTVARDVPPLKAVRALLSGRAACLASGDARCLRPLEAPGSPVAHADGAALDAGTDPVAADPARARLLSSGAGSAIVDADGVTVLAVREPGAWRLRDVVAEASR